VSQEGLAVCPHASRFPLHQRCDYSYPVQRYFIKDRFVFDLRRGRLPAVIQVRVELFGRAASQSGLREAVLELPEGATLRDAAETLVRRCPVLQWVPQVCRPARNLEYARWEDPVAEGDELSFIPPVSGGSAA